VHHVGIDLHSSQATICVLDGRGNRVKRGVVRGSIREVVRWLRDVPRPFGVCFEASTGYGRAFEELARVARTVKVAHPGHLRLIFRAKKKNDRVDAEKLAKLLFLGEVPQIHVPRRDVRAWRSLINYRHRLIGSRTRTKNAIRALLRELGETPPCRLWTKKGVAWLAELKIDDATDALRRDVLLDELGHEEVLVKRVEKELNRRAGAHPGVQLLMTVPGIGVRTAEALVAWIDRPARFGNARSVAGYFGLVPSQDQSGDTNRMGHVTRQGPACVRRLLVEAAWQAIRRSPEIRAFFERVARGDPDRRKIAIVATANYLARVAGAMLLTGELWRGAA
jgi:transposase